MFPADPEELCGSEGSSLSGCPQSSGAKSHDALLQRAQAAEERARFSEEALARAMDDLHKLKSVMFFFITTRCDKISLLLVNLGWMFFLQCTCSVLLYFCTTILGPAGGHSEPSIADTSTRIPCGRSLEEGER